MISIDSHLCPVESPYFCTFLWAIVPLLELRASIPLGYFEFELSIYEAVVISVIGGILTTAIVMFLLPVFIKFFEKHSPLFDRIMKRILEKTRAKHSHKMEVMGDIFLVTFVAIPLPGSGAWTGVLIAYLFGIPYKKALTLISIGVFFSGVIIALLTLFGHEIWNVFNGE